VESRRENYIYTVLHTIVAWPVNTKEQIRYFFIYVLPPEETDWRSIVNPVGCWWLGLSNRAHPSAHSIRHGVIVIDYSFLSNRNRLNWPKMKCDRNRLHCQFNRNRRLLSRLNLEIFTLHHCAKPRLWCLGFLLCDRLL